MGRNGPVAKNKKIFIYQDFYLLETTAEPCKTRLPAVSSAQRSNIFYLSFNKTFFLKMSVFADFKTNKKNVLFFV